MILAKSLNIRREAHEGMMVTFEDLRDGASRKVFH
jgi:hypothetical protein